MTNLPFSVSTGRAISEMLLDRLAVMFHVLADAVHGVAASRHAQTGQHAECQYYDKAPHRYHLFAENVKAHRNYITETDRKERRGGKPSFFSRSAGLD
jgi:hypothetical protein